MKNYTLYIVLLFSIFLKAQTQDTLKLTAQDSAVLYSIELKEIVVTKTDASIAALDEHKKRMLILKRRIYRVYPYAKLTAEKLMQINATMDKLKTTKEKKKYFKLVENYLQEEFEPKLKKLSRKDGQILVKLISRQTGETTYDLIKDYKSGWKAFWYNTTANLFKLSLKEEYQPESVNEDFLIEDILQRAFQNDQLQYQSSKLKFDFTQIITEKKAEINVEEYKNMFAKMKKKK